MVIVKNAKGNQTLCHDCKKELEVLQGEIKDGVELLYEDGGDKIAVLKCNDCYQKNPALNNFRKCEVYSRIVGYLRPVNQWNEAKKVEFRDRKAYKLTS